MNIDSVYLALVSLEFYRYLNYLESNLNRSHQKSEAAKT